MKLGFPSFIKNIEDEKMEYYKEHVIIIIPALLLVFGTAYALSGWGNKPEIPVSETKQPRTAEVVRETFTDYVPEVPSKPKVYVEIDHDHEELDLNDPLASPSFDTMEEGVSIVSYKDQPIPQLFKDLTKKAVEEMAERGYASAEESNVRTISRVLEPRLKHLMLSYDEAANQLVKEPANLEGTPFDDGELLGAHTGGSNHDGKWTNISRFYKFDDLGVVKLREVDYITSRGRIQMTQELINEDVNGRPAIYRVNVSNSGAAVTLVSWATDSKKYVLYAEKNGAKDESVKQRLLELAQAIPAD
ncbi:hypothetical protein BPLS_P2474 [Bathymodiolus platifrons methanotrophic gill symbiont]|uniref:hypothetical protein n=1 Tax=Bathymodiolus platifrons methanotrophic gill symbiont TaxID=113268 RepID=UPI001B70959E|nr:hypothetical protein [Bathymodiolus platifrons methanotrophic gill symbiont]GFO75317.1 hypothetical protein BPLS_P2474 [Bathymodiolus platifrons methanotrophic gill symbiont]